MRILLIEDEAKVARLIQRGLREEGFAVDLAGDGEEGLYMAKTMEYDLVILDIMLPGKDGFDVLKQLREAGGEARVLILTARGAVGDRVRGLNLGADDYLKKPFDFEELIARVRALMRRQTIPNGDILRLDDLVLDRRARTVTRGERTLELTPKEFSILELLALNPGTIISKTRISEYVWDDPGEAMSNVVEVTVYRLREKVDRHFEHQMIHTARGAGYMIKARAPSR